MKTNLSARTSKLQLALNRPSVGQNLLIEKSHCRFCDLRVAPHLSSAFLINLEKARRPSGANFTTRRAALAERIYYSKRRQHWLHSMQRNKKFLCQLDKF